jgi:4-oxalocrotonate tautomerase
MTLLRGMLRVFPNKEITVPALRVDLFAGRTLEQKRALAVALTEACVKALGVSPSSVDIIFNDVERHDWATAGKLWSDDAKPASPSST